VQQAVKAIHNENKIMSRRAIGKWLIHDDRKELLEIVVALALNVIFVTLIALLLWPIGKPVLALRLAKGYGVLWIVSFLISVLLNRLHRLFRIDMYTHANAFVISNLAASCFLQMGWSAFATLTVQNLVVDAPIWIAVSLYLVGFFSCLSAYFAVSSFYQGHIYKMISLPLALVSFMAFSVWPASGRVLYGWFFDLF
jgi:hypothetical protein